MGPNHFLSGLTTIQSLQNEEKIGEKRRKCLLDKIALFHLMTNFLSLSTVFVFPFLDRRASCRERVLVAV